MSYSAESAEFEFEPWRSSTVTLSATAIDWAVQVGQQEPDPAQQWPTFLWAMAVQGLQQWLAAGGQGMALDCDRVGAAPGQENRPFNSAATCRVNNFRLAVVAQGSLSDEVVTIPQASLEDAASFAHLYVLAEVQEEVDQVTILAGLRRDRLLAHLRQGDFAAPADGTYRVPVQYFDTSPEDILLYLTCLDPEQLAAASPTADPSPARPSLLTQRTGDLINAGRWLRDQLDTVAAGLAWTLLPPLAPAHAMMSTSTPAEALEAVLRDLEATGVSIPTTARGAYTDLQQFGLPFRLYALTWTIFEPRPPEWSLFLFLGPVPGEQLPPGTRLIVRDAEATLAEQSLSPDPNAAYLYAQVIGTWDEQFTATIELPNGTTLNWPPFVFRPEV